MTKPYERPQSANVHRQSWFIFSKSVWKLRSTRTSSAINYRTITNAQCQGTQRQMTVHLFTEKVTEMMRSVVTLPD